MKSDLSTFNGIVKEFYEPLYWHIRRIVLSHDDAKDLVQDTFIKAYRKLWMLRDTNALRPWLYRIATNLSLNFVKRKKNYDALAEEMMCADGDLAQTYSAEIKFEKALLTLSPQQRSAFCLRYYENMDYPEMAQATGSSVESLRVSYHNAKEKIKKYVEEN